MKKLFILLLCFLSACTEQKKEIPEQQLINLVESTQIIRTLIHNNKLNTLLEDHAPEQLDLLLNNMSPAKIAFEVEVLSSTIPLIVVYYFKENLESRNFIEKLKKLAIIWDNQIKFVTIDVEKLFVLVQDADIQEIPTLLFVKDREVIDKIEGIANTDAFEEKLNIHNKTIKTSY